jgi:hypothetical protein
MGKATDLIARLAGDVELAKASFRPNLCRTDLPLIDRPDFDPVLLCTECRTKLAAFTGMVFSVPFEVELIEDLDEGEDIDGFEDWSN